MRRIGFVTLFPEQVLGVLGHSIMGRAQERELAQFHTTNPRDFATDAHRSVDDRPFGGGPGMVMMPHLVEQALQSLPYEKPHVVLCDAAAPLFTQADAERLGEKPELVFICGHYEGVDERVRTQLADEALSIGDYVLTGGELPALVMTDAIVRLGEGVLGTAESHEDDSHSSGLLGFPLYTQPVEFRGEQVPEVLRSGHHGKIAAWRREQQLRRTRAWRPDLFCRADLTPEDLKLL